jgi:methenyltetrahydromethanopterin cyclohydrolase
VPAEQLRVLVAPTASLAGSIQIAARSIETGLHKLHHLGFDLGKLRIATGLCPIAPPTSSDWQSIGLTNDFMMFGAQVWLAVGECEDQELADLAQRVPASASEGYGKRFLEILEEKGGFYNVDPGIFAPAEITLANLSNGHCFHGGKREDERLGALLVGG